MNTPVSMNSVPTPSTHTNLFMILASIVAVVILFALYFHSFGYSIQLGWDKLKWSRENGETVQMNIPGTDLTGELIPTSDIEAALDGLAKHEVFNIRHNIYSFSDAEPLCKAFGAELASYEQVKEAYEKGADWCNYGWSKGQLALYPTQEESWKKLQGGTEEQRTSCGKPGINGGYFGDSDMQFGVNCYGVRPAKTKLDESVIEHDTTNPFDSRVNQFKSELEDISVTPWNGKQWSQ